MKKIYILLFVLFAVNNSNAQGWQWLNPVPTGNDLKSVYFTNANTGYAVGGNGTIMKTIDGGTNWIRQNSGTAYNIYSVCFTDFNTGYAVGNYGTILKTINGGTDWMTLSSGATNMLLSVYFPSPDIGYIVGYYGTILKTTDGGNQLDDPEFRDYKYFIFRFFYKSGFGICGWL